MHVMTCGHVLPCVCIFVFVSGCQMAHANEIARVVARGVWKCLSLWSGQGSNSVSQNVGTRKSYKQWCRGSANPCPKILGHRHLVKTSVSPVRSTVSQNVGTQPHCTNKLSSHTWLDYQDNKQNFQMRLSTHRTFK